MPRRRKSVAPQTPERVLSDAVVRLQRDLKNATQAGSTGVQLVDKKYYLTPTEGEIIFDYPRKQICVWHDEKWWCTGGMIWQKYRRIATTGNNAVVISSTPCYYGGHYIDNDNISNFRFVHLYDKTTAPLAGDTPAMTIGIPPDSGANQEYSGGVEFVNGLAMSFSSARTGGISGVSATELVATILYNDAF